jgi:D-alanyl-lipoteichoic acid acyltransferase DltB (MBOAT superfamily)
VNIILPVGISFYTFQTLSYTIDVYKKKLEPTKDFISFSAFVSFFPQLVAGPIERATDLLPQFYNKRSFDYIKAVDGMRQILWGLFKKIVIADSCAEYANLIFNNSADYSGSTLVIGAIFFTFQIYGDFSGYSDIAIGTSRLFGFDLKQNFAFPYFSRNIAEFWRRWHISLSTWFRDYLYIPLGGSRGEIWMKVRNTFIIFIVSGFWHGANWTFIAWGTLNAIYFLPLLLTDNNRNNIEIVAQGKILPNLKEFSFMLLTFGFTVFAWIFFRAESIGHAFSYISDIISPSLLSTPYIIEAGTGLSILPKTIFLLIGLFIFVEWLGRESQYAIENFGIKWPKHFRWAFYCLMVVGVFLFSGQKQDFIYFQF